MEKIVYTKFTQNLKLAAKLLAAGYELKNRYMHVEYVSKE